MGIRIVNENVRLKYFNSSYITTYIVFNPLKPASYVMYQKVYHSAIVRSAHTVFMCFVFI